MKEISFPFTFFYPRIFTREKRQLTETGGAHTSPRQRLLPTAEAQYQYANEAIHIPITCKCWTIKREMLWGDNLGKTAFMRCKYHSVVCAHLTILLFRFEDFKEAPEAWGTHEC